ncbi:hypothetical protein [Oceanibium sediminis]|uniref:hypothetical protein n=1 Tax=Oceanibium sediminis TaxID=2026339 RepID=UPI000DD3C098|nr:hypothetical protein [Oceanibium sediminis]
MRIAVLAVALCAGLAPLPCGAEAALFGPRPHWEQTEQMQQYRERLYAAHLACCEGAKLQLMGLGEARACGDIYLRLKLSFLNGVTPERYVTMHAATRAVAHDKGYAAYRAWVHRQTAARQ